MAYVEKVAALPAKSLRVSRALTHSPAERQVLKERVRYEAEFLKERWFSEDAKAAMKLYLKYRNEWESSLNFKTHFEMKNHQKSMQKLNNY